uniref:Uncharacterized protein n=1 Tax=Myoviridae sp. cte0t5 TaxID=2823549 RepID=A0A8S5LHE2_9CAUD|nr:MAG TPA: hypothetical protein [Myoviridae sp. cte0t5]
MTISFGNQSESLGVDSVPVRGEEAARTSYLAESTLGKSLANGALREWHHHCRTRGRTRPGKPPCDGNRPFGTVKLVVSRSATYAGN